MAFPTISNCLCSLHFLRYFAQAPFPILWLRFGKSYEIDFRDSLLYQALLGLCSLPSPYQHSLNAKFPCSTCQPIMLPGTVPELNRSDIVLWSFSQYKSLPPFQLSCSLFGLDHLHQLHELFIFPYGPMYCTVKSPCSSNSSVVEGIAST